tara:strand:+ start:43 stop:270 length:228 start_codon:yes stop_codon:yes gene_type:complete
MVEQKSYRIVHNDGSELTPYEQGQTDDLMRKFKEAKVLGDNSIVGVKQLLRMVGVVMDNYSIIGTHLVASHEGKV